jgi:transposase
MRDIELYKAILGLTPPWTVVNVTLDVKTQHVMVQVQAGEGPFPCPECRTAVPGYDKKFRRWRHLDTCQFTTWIEAEVPRVECPTHGVKQHPVPWAEPGSQFTALFERFAIDLLRECAVQGGADLLRITWDEAWGIKARAVARGLARRGLVKWRKTREISSMPFPIPLPLLSPVEAHPRLAPCSQVISSPATTLKIASTMLIPFGGSRCPH